MLLVLASAIARFGWLGYSLGVFIGAMGDDCGGILFRQGSRTPRSAAGGSCESTKLIAAPVRWILMLDPSSG
jgi:hypothetical protein